jgi:triosephosphate isomerase (TIM)
MRTLIAGNWKMNGGLASLDVIEAIASAARGNEAVDVALCVPATLIAPAAARVPAFMIGAQDCHAQASGAHTGCLSAAMLVEAGACLAIVGHSERRADQHESSVEVCAKAQAVMAAGMVAIICVGESEAERDAGDAIAVVRAQLIASVPAVDSNALPVIAYEPVWAIGTGRTPSTTDVADMHAAIRATLIEHLGAAGANVRILYGGSVKPSNAAELLALPGVDGALVGGASLSVADFVPIIAAAQALARD